MRPPVTFSSSRSDSSSIKAIGINPEVVDPEDVEMLEDMLVAAFNEAMRQIDEESERELEKVTGGLNIPGL